jgi:hypothetical protein
MRVYFTEFRSSKLDNTVFGSLLTILGEEEINGLFKGYSTRKRIYTIFTVLEMYLHQVINGIGCEGTIVWAINQGILKPGVSTNNSCYSQARSRLQVDSLVRLYRAVGNRVEGQARSADSYKKRRVKVVDGTEVQLLDTKRNQSEYPQPTSQSPGCGFPVMRVVALMGLGSGTILDCSVGPLSKGERTLFKDLWTSLEPGDILLGDRGFGSYAEVAYLTAMGCDVVFRQRKGSLKNKKIVEILGKNDFLIEWERPKRVGNWTSPGELPEKMKVRAIRYKCKIRGKIEEVILFTTLIDRRAHPARDLKDLYQRRWNIETRLKDIKTTMGLEFITSKSPQGCLIQLYIGLLAHNLVRAVMLDAAKIGRIPIIRISFKGAIDRIIAFGDSRLMDKDFERWYRFLLKDLVKTKVPFRPGRYEYRERKRRPTRFKLKTNNSNPSPVKARAS